MIPDRANADQPQAVSDSREEPQPKACPACIAKRVHTLEDWKLHPGEGKTGRNRDEER